MQGSLSSQTWKAMDYNQFHKFYIDGMVYIIFIWKMRENGLN